MNHLLSYRDFLNVSQDARSFTLELEERDAPQHSEEREQIVTKNPNYENMERNLLSWTIDLHRKRRPDSPSSTSYRMISLIFDDAFSEIERRVFIAGFNRWLDVTVECFENNTGFSDIQDYDFQLPPEVMHPGGIAFPNDWTDHTKLYLFMATMTNRLAPEPADRLPRYRPIYLRRYEEDGGSSPTWNLGRAEVDIFNSRGVFDISLNAKAATDFTQDPDVWAGLFQHELMHNMGWSHSAMGCRSDSGGSRAFICQVQQYVKNWSR